jgi:hypothetical protein
MSAPTQLTITLTDSSTITVNIPAGLQNLNSTQTNSSGYDSIDLMLDAVFRRKYFYDSTRTTAYSVELIKSITWS